MTKKKKINAANKQLSVKVWSLNVFDIFESNLNFYIKRLHDKKKKINAANKQLSVKVWSLNVFDIFIYIFKWD